MGLNWLSNFRCKVQDLIRKAFERVGATSTQELHASVFPPSLFSFLFRSGPFNQLADCLPENALSFHWSSWFGQPNHLHWVAMHTFQRYGWCGHKNCYLSGVEYGISGVGIFCWGQKPFGINEMMLIWAKERSNELRHYTRHIYLFRFEIYAIPTKKLHVLRHRIYIWTKVILCRSLILARNMYTVTKTNRFCQIKKLGAHTMVQILDICLYFKRTWTDYKTGTERVAIRSHVRFFTCQFWKKIQKRRAQCVSNRLSRDREAGLLWARPHQLLALRRKTCKMIPILQSILTCVRCF